MVIYFSAVVIPLQNMKKNIVQIIGFSLFTWTVGKLHADISSKHNFYYSAFNKMKRKTETTKLSSLQKKVPTFYVSRLLK